MIRFLPLLLGLMIVLGATGAVRAQAPPPFRSDRILVEARGSGPDIVLIPGLASTGAVWRDTADRLDDRHRVHVVTIRGFGEAPVGANGEGAMVGPLADELRRYIAANRLDRPAVIGHSMGGLIALRAAADAGRSGGPGPGRVMVVDAAPFFPSLISSGAVAGDVEPIAQIAYQAIMFLGDDALRGQGALLGGELGGAADSLFDSLGWQGGDRHTLAQSLYEVMTLDLRHRLPDIRVPVTVIYGWSRDDTSPRAHTDQLFRAAYASLPDPPTFEPIEGAEHMVMIDQPARFLAAVERFLAD